jgi:uncharacterized protein with PQ loop repeat
MGAAEIGRFYFVFFPQLFFVYRRKCEQNLSPRVLLASRFFGVVGIFLWGEISILFCFSSHMERQFFF